MHSVNECCQNRSRSSAHQAVLVRLSGFTVDIPKSLLQCAQVIYSVVFAPFNNSIRSLEILNIQ